jgi:hypothetical protein
MDDESIPTTDYDEWISLPLDQLTLEHVLHAQQVIQMILAVLDWAKQSEMQTWLPSLAELVLEDNFLLMWIFFSLYYSSFKIMSKFSRHDPLSTRWDSDRTSFE